MVEWLNGRIQWVGYTPAHPLIKLMEWMSMVGALALALAITQAGSVMATVSILCAFITIIEFCESE